MTAMVHEVVIPDALYRVVTELTHQPEVETALTVAVKELIRLRQKELDAERVVFEAKYGMTFAQFNARFQAEEIPDQYSYAVESDYFDWEAAVTSLAYLEELSATVL